MNRVPGRNRQANPAYGAFRPALALFGAALLASCGSGGEAPPPGPIAVSVVKATPQALTLADELPGRVVPFRIAEIRPQVSGIVERRLFEQGAQVRAGQPLFQINPQPFQAEAASAAAGVQRAEAALARARVQADRLKPLVAADAISRQSYDDAVAARDQAAADLAEARAALSRRRLDVGFARVTAPISGQIGPSLVTEGALVSAAAADPLATVQQIDKVYVDVRQPVARIEALREAIRNGTADPNAPVTILASSGKPYPVTGRALFSDISVDPGTGDAVVRVLVPNPDHVLLPGMFVRARLPRAHRPAALTVPQQAVLRDAQGRAQISVVDGKGRVKPRTVEVGEVVDGNYVVLSGLKPGEQVVVEGHDRIQGDAPVKPVPWRAPAPAAN